MSDKLNIQDLIDLLAEKHSMNRSDAESFVREFFALIEESLEKDKYVKIRGLGTFKLINVESLMWHLLLSNPICAQYSIGQILQKETFY